MNAAASTLSTRTTRPLALALLCLAGAALLPAITLLPHPRVVALGLVMALVLLLHLTLRRLEGQVDYFEILVPLSFFQILSYPVGTYFLLENPKYLIYQSLYDYLVPALGLGVVAYLALVAGYELSFRRLGPSPLMTARLVGLKPVLFLAGLGFAGQTAGIVIQRSLMVRRDISGVLSGIQQLSPLFLAAWFLAWHTAWSSAVPRRGRFLGPMLLAPQVAYAIFGTIGGKEFTITLIAVPALAFWYARRKLPVKTLITVALLAIFVVFPLYNTFRLQNRHLATAARLERTLNTAQDWDRSDYMQASLEAFMSRVAVVTSPAAVIRSVGRWVDYRHGETLASAVLSFVPRVVWPNKPVLTTGREFGTTFGLVNMLDRETQIACTLAGELYWNFGVPGVVGWAFLLGAVCRFIYQRFGFGGTDDGIRKALYLPLLVQLAGSEAQQALLLASLVKTIVLFYGAVWVLERMGWVARERASEPAALSPVA